MVDTVTESESRFAVSTFVISITIYNYRERDREFMKVDTEIEKEKLSTVVYIVVLCGFYCNKKWRERCAHTHAHKVHGGGYCDNEERWFIVAYVIQRREKVMDMGIFIEKERWLPSVYIVL